MPTKSIHCHGTCVAQGEVAVLLRGPSGSGKSDLAYRFLNLPNPGHSNFPHLVADDQVILTRQGGQIFVAPPPAIKGKLELRGIGIIELPYLENAELRLIVDLHPPGEIERLPERNITDEILDLKLPLIRLTPFEPSAALKLRAAINMLSKEFSHN